MARCCATCADSVAQPLSSRITQTWPPPSCSCAREGSGDVSKWAAPDARARDAYAPPRARCSASRDATHRRPRTRYAASRAAMHR
eukprot:3993085-Prymnesium_polylepis.1